ncbi:MAG: response regulator [Phycisphaeraceae bacterium]|nr:response regulator [Phycisphaeraceae bacterium]
MPLADVLIIDNDEGLVRAMETRLSALGYRCRTAFCGTQGMAEFAAGGVDLIITDLNMPTLDGAAVVREVRRQSDVPVIVVTGFPQQYAAALACYRGVTVLRKPFHSNELIDLVATELALHSGRRAG